MCMYGSGGRSGKVDFLMGLSMLLKSLNSTLKVSQLHYKEINKKKKKAPVCFVVWLCLSVCLFPLSSRFCPHLCRPISAYLDMVYLVEYWKYCNKIIFKYINSTVGPIFNEIFFEKWGLWWVLWIMHGPTRKVETHFF